MCNQGFSGEMESSVASAPASSSDEPPRVKFLCSFGGGVLPRPLDGRLRYVGGETRIVSVPRDVSYDELMARMRELFEGVSVIKYQQPDEDLDALVSVVNDDDVMNMMEEYDKLGAAGDGFTRLRIFLFSHQHSDLDVAGVVGSPFDSNERESERRYVDALNSLNDTMPQPGNDVSEQLFIDSGLHDHLHHLKIPHPSHGQRYGDIEGSWSPAYYSPGPHTPSSPSSARYHITPGELSDRIAEEYARHSPGFQQPPLDHQSPHFLENVVWLPPGAIVQEKAGFPSNLGNSHNAMEGNSICNNCRMVFQRGQSPVSDPRYLDPRWKHGQPQVEQPGNANEYVSQFPNSCGECYPNKEAYMLGQDLILDHGVYVKEQGEQRAFYNESHNHDRSRVVHHHQMNQRLEDPRSHLSGTGRVNEFVVDGNGLNPHPILHGGFYDGHPLPPSNCINHDDTRLPRPGIDLSNEVFLDQHSVGSAPHAHILSPEDPGARFGNHPAYGTENLYQGQQNLAPIQPLRRQMQVPVRPGYESPIFVMPNGVSPRFSHVGVDDSFQNPWTIQNGGTSQRIFGFDGPPPPEYMYDQVPKMNANISTVHDSRLSFSPDSAHCLPGIMPVEVPTETLPLTPPQSCLADEKLVDASSQLNHLKIEDDAKPSIRAAEDKILPCVASGQKHLDVGKEADVCLNAGPKKVDDTDSGSHEQKPIGEEGYIAKHSESDGTVAHGQAEVSEECLSFLPDLMASVKKAMLEEAEEVKARAQEDSDHNVSSLPDQKESSLLELEPGKGNEDLDIDSEDDDPKVSKIEPTTAEAEALAKGLQTIKNDDLEEIRELGSGTYGSVYHGKWKGSDVAIKRIKASCFAGKPSERERLIADFWREALILSSLHHPNVVSFYGVVRDGPDGSVATVTEFMVNGSLKQFLKKKDRTIDRRKRLIIAMDSAFGMEYLHGKNIVHFDLKCENLLVNMRDPQRPICKIGDLGLSKVKQHTLVSGGVRGTLPWMAPELLSGKSNMVSEKIDVYSFGIVMWELLTGEEPYADMHCASIIENWPLLAPIGLEPEDSMILCLTCYMKIAFSILALKLNYKNHLVVLYLNGCIFFGGIIAIVITYE
ncbi:uncharacterized protein LOC120266479 isoform X3 [Dioscorea cayenensis subsp. rotundata]|uniref:Uncharacterized protein LOC120266479 isoform X3 n=1 Tax=Dioscorea cayennensis subsp. rotundata TaxID=55577 RepID=A0AB40BUE7_DIOCR|nr:uncharacterized protein LOC120266479 isoform X3 [Dioscorea cayenensis subsp. rotundata]XP_039130050.1 uncharacterized protein LOC120266479 isoform X3 [Dioscorea cayenensis subsp. rotundata]